MPIFSLTSLCPLQLFNSTILSPTFSLLFVMAGSSWFPRQVPLPERAIVIGGTLNTVFAGKPSVPPITEQHKEEHEFLKLHGRRLSQTRVHRSDSEIGTVRSGCKGNGTCWLQ